MSETAEFKGLDDLTDEEYDLLVELGEKVTLMRYRVEKEQDLVYLASLHDAERVFDEACEGVGADIDVMRFELAGGFCGP